MNRTILLPVAAAAAVSLLTVLLAAPERGAVPAAPPVPARARAPEAGPADLARRLELLSGRVARLEERTAEAPPAEVPLADLERRLARTEAAVRTLTGPSVEELAALDEEQLAAQARSSCRAKDYTRALRYWEAILAREPDDALRGEALAGAGTCLRTLHRFEEEERAWWALARLQGEETAEGLGALFQVAWSRSCREDWSEAVRLMRHVADAPATSPSFRRWARFWSADYLVRSGDPEGARPILAALVREFADSRDSNELHCLSRAQALLTRLDAR